VDRSHLAELIATERDYWWHVAKRELVIDVLRRHFPPPRRLLEVGIGSGGNLIAFQQLGYDVAGLDLLPESVSRLRQRGIADVQVHDIETPWPLSSPLPDVIVMLDVLEHLREPATALQHAARVLARGGGVVLTVPAGPWLTSSWDAMLGHHRRYTRAMLTAHAQEAGYRMAWLSHWNSFSLAPAAAVRLSERFRIPRRSTAFPRVPATVGRLLLQCARAERALLRRTPIPCGLSLVGVLTR
jgi:SAM-dependent methyltransferase